MIIKFHFFLKLENYLKTNSAVPINKFYMIGDNP